MFDNLDDPKRQALLMLAAGLLSPTQAKGGAGAAQALSRAIPMGLLGYNEASQNKRRNSMEDMQRQMHEMQLAQMRRQSDDQAYGAQIAPQFFNAGNAPADGMGPAMPPKQDFAGYGAAMASRNPAMAMPYIQAGMKDETPISLAPNASLIDRKTLKPIVTNTPPEKPDKPPELIRYQSIADDPTQPEAIRRVAAEYVKKATTHAPAANVTTNVMPPREVFKDSLTLKKDFDGTPEVKAFKEVRMAWDQISTALARPSAANDLAAATKFMKMLDPGSVVRESELAMAMQASGAFDRMANYHNLLIDGKKLTPKQREDFYASGKALYEAASGRYDETVKQYEGIAKQYNLDPSFIYRGTTKLTKNTTATYKAKQAIKAGAPRDQVIKRMIQEGYDTEGL